MADEVTPTENSATILTDSVSDAAPALANETTALGNDPAPDAEAASAADVAGDDGAGKPDGDKAEAEKVIPEAYELTPPEGMTLDADTLALATPVFKDLGLSNDQAQSLIPVAGEFAKKIADGMNNQILAGITAQRKEWFDTSKADPEIGGANWDKTLSTASMALDKLGATKGSPFRTLLDDSGLGNHPEMIRMMKRVGEAIGEDASFARSDTTGSAKKTDAELFYGSGRT